MRVLSGKRLLRKIGRISDEQFLSLERQFLEFYKKTDPFLRERKGSSGA